MKLLLIDPPFKSFTGIFGFYFPLGLAYLAGAAKKAGFDCSILDMDAAEPKTGTLDFTHEYERYQHYIKAVNDPRHPTWELLRSLVVGQKPDVIGISAMTTKFGTTMQTIRFCREVLPHVPIIVGGPHASTMPDLTMRMPEVDYVLRGEADESLPELLCAIRDGGDPAKIRGLSYRKGDRVIHNPDRAFAQNLDTLALPARDALLNPENYSSEDMGVILTSRGCPFACSYCFHMWERRVRYRSIPGIIGEIVQVHQAYGTTQFSIKDDSFTVKKSHVRALCEAIRKLPFRISWSCTTRVDLIEDEILEIMKAAGCVQVSVGIETGSARILQETDKGITHAQIERAARMLNKHRIFWSGYFMIGLPTETEEDIRLTMEYLRKVRPYYGGLGVYNPFPRTKLFDQGVELGLLDPDPPLEHFLTTNPKDLFFRDPKKRVVALSHEKFEQLVAEATRVFHTHNTNPFSMIRRGFARRRTYMADPSLLRRDLSKAWDMVRSGFGLLGSHS
ncbi:MAG TPA: radical SAM protein [Candidatus Ozemobacteraceae bacterium]